MFCIKVQKLIKQLLITAPKSVLFCQRFTYRTYKAAKSLVPILSPLTSNEFWIHDSFSLPDEVSSFCPNHFLASLDVESLFTNIPLNEDIEIRIDDLLCDTNTIHNLYRNDMRELLTLAA